MTHNQTFSCNNQACFDFMSLFAGMIRTRVMDITVYPETFTVHVSFDVSHPILCKRTASILDSAFSAYAQSERAA